MGAPIVKRTPRRAMMAGAYVTTNTDNDCGKCNAGEPAVLPVKSVRATTGKAAGTTCGWPYRRYEQDTVTRVPRRRIPWRHRRDDARCLTRIGRKRGQPRGCHVEDVVRTRQAER